MGDYNNKCKEHLLDLLKSKKSLTNSKVNLCFSGNAQAFVNDSQEKLKSIIGEYI